MDQHIAHVALLVRDYDEALAYFCGTLGFRLVEDTPLGPTKRWCLVAPPGGGTSLLLARAADDVQAAQVGNQGGGRVFLFLETDDFARDHATLVGRGVKFTEAPRHEPYGTVAVFEDLHGNRWDLLQRTGPDIRVLTPAEYDAIWAAHGAAAFQDDTPAFRYRDALSEAERRKEDALRARMGDPYRLHLGVFVDGEVAGWSWGHQESAEAFYMVNSAVLPAYRGRGLYAALLRALLARVAEQGFQRIYSRHKATNNAIIVPKLKAGFVVTALELSDRFGTLVQLTYFPNEKRRKVAGFRAGQVPADDELRALLGLQATPARPCPEAPPAE